MPISQIIVLLETVVSDIPLLVQLVTKLIEIYKSKEAPTEDDWTEINAICDKAHTDLQAENTSDK